jgi:hypothetical protein
VSASSGSVERVFSSATDILHAKRSRTKADLFQMLMFIKRNACINLKKYIGLLAKINFIHYLILSLSYFSKKADKDKVQTYLYLI